MMRAIFDWLYYTLDSAPAIALSGAFIWGILSILLSPCHLASIPLIIGFIDAQGNITTKRAFRLSLLFSVGILITIAVIGLLTGLAGRMLGDIGKIGNYSVAVIFFAIGLHLMEIIRIPFAGATGDGYKKKGAAAAFVLGLVFGVALGPCTFAFMAPMLGIAFKVASNNLPYAIGLILAYAVGHCSVIVLAGTFTEAVQHYLNWNEKSKGAVILKKICGALVILGGVYIILS
ncbi:cytochrome c biogenesis protein CcdA [bacterium]|nr:cytochrome c biogenesis protein CcdA [bacterium]